MGVRWDDDRDPRRPWAWWQVAVLVLLVGAAVVTLALMPTLPGGG
jgi:hypothetical protein